jgi:hypothetical protein
MHKPTGNGSGKFEVHTQDMGGWVRVFGDQRHDLPPDLPVFLSHSLTAWLRQRPQLRLIVVVAVSREGNTVELHAWYEQHVFPDVSPLSPPPPPA